MTAEEPVAQPAAHLPQTSRRHFLQWTGAAGAGAVAATLIPGTASAADPELRGSSAEGGSGRLVTPTFDPIRPPAIPLAVRSPYLSTWMPADNSSGTWPTFWTGRVTAMDGIIRVDGTAFLFFGSEPSLTAAVKYPLPTMREISVEVTATQSRFILQNGGIELALTFLLAGRAGGSGSAVPAAQLHHRRRQEHRPGEPRRQHLPRHLRRVGLGQQRDADRLERAAAQRRGRDLISLSYAPAAPRVFAEDGDTAEWGTVVWNSEDRAGLTWEIGPDADTRTRFVTTGRLGNAADSRQPRAISDQWPVFAFSLAFGRVGGKTTTPLVISVGQVREPAINYLGTPLLPLWKSYYPDWQGMVAAFHHDYSAAVRRSAVLDAKIAKDARKVGGEEYAALCALALRQAYAGTELVSNNGKPWAFLKEISSDGNVSTIDVTYPCMPVFLYLDPAYLGLILAPILDYVENHNYPKTFAPHDLGSNYPNATGHLNGMGEEDMPVEESANMLIMATAYLTRTERRDRAAYATAHYKIFQQWADYLVQNALDPGNQNQTDDFTGFIAHSVNLALKGIVAIGAMGEIATAAGKLSDASRYTATARSYIRQWVRMGTDSTGDHLKLAYDQEGTWSLKYNGYPDKLLRLGLIPDHVAATEAAWYLSRDNTYGVPLDIRHTFTKDDWELWTAAWLKQYPDLLRLFINSVYAFANTSARRVPTSDWYDTVTGAQVGFQDRPVVGGFFAPLTV